MARKKTGKTTSRSGGVKSRKKTSRRSTKAAVKKAGKTARATSRSKKGARADRLDRANIPSLALEDFEPQIELEEGVRDKSRGSTRFAWLGTGQCGGRLVKAFYDLGYHKAIAVNTTYHDLDDLGLPEDQKLLMDIGRKGAGKDMNRGRDAAVQYRQQIIHAVQQIFGEGVDHVMLAFGSGGGTGSGSIVSLIDTVRTCAKHMGLPNPDNSIGVLCTLPTSGEAGSPKVGSNAYRVMTELTSMAAEGKISPLIIIDNEKIRRMYPGLTVKNFWPTVNNTVAGLFDIFNRLSSLSSPYTSFDPVDYQSILHSGGCTIMGLSNVKFYKRRFDLSEAVKNNLAKTLLASGFNLETAKVAGCIALGGSQQMSNVAGLQDNINYAFDVLTDITGEATIHRGVYENGKAGLRVYTIIGGLDTPHERLEQLVTTV